CNISVFIEKLFYCLRFRQSSRVIQGSILHIGRLPIPSPVAVRIVYSGLVFIYQPVAIVVDPFIPQQLVFTNLSRLGEHHTVRIVWIHLVTTSLGLSTHHDYMSITVQVIEHIFSNLSIPVIIKWPSSRT